MRSPEVCNEDGIRLKHCTRDITKWAHSAGFILYYYDYTYVSIHVCQYDKGFMFSWVLGAISDAV